jgi:amidohydrolase
MPHQGVDAISAGAAMVNSLQSIVNRELNPLEPVVINVCEFKAGTRFNVMAGEAYLSGTTRTFNEEIRSRLPAIMERVLLKTAEAYRAELRFRYDEGSSVVINDPDCAALARTAVEKTLGPEAVTLYERTLMGENFAEYQRVVPGVFAFLGSRNPSKGADAPHHSECFNIDEEVLPGGAAVAAQYALDYLAGA